MGEIAIRLLAFVILIFLSAFFSGSEAAYFSFSKEMIERLRESAIGNARRIVWLLNDPRQLLITILVGNTIVNVSAATLAALLTADVSTRLGISHKITIISEVLVVTIVLLILGELMPKIVAVKKPLYFAGLAAIPLRFVSIIFYPVVLILNRFPGLISGLLASRVKPPLLSKEELKTLLEMSEEKGALAEEEKEMIHSIFEFSKTTVKEIMVPRIDMVTVEKETSLQELIELIKTEGHSRIPLYEEQVDNILGIIHAKDLLPFLDKIMEPVDLAALVRPAFFVPETKPIDELLKDFQVEKQHMAIVVDEYGGTAGLITLEDVIEEIVGEIQDEYDIEEQPLYRRIDANHFLVDAKIDLDVLNEELDMNLPVDPSYETLGGFIFNLIGAVPAKKQQIDFDGYQFIIEKIDRNRILEVMIIKTAPSSKQETNLLTDADH
ncbi:MAG: hemolysin family protein [candidate division KSB1 bacterium]|nr:hemolysin family protein [candidate division KSB1 bacterium]MDZ7341039.1 hemolysin family protein [candidate division KSB1 bacterium]